MKPYAEFKKDVSKLFEYAIAKGELLRLGQYMDIDFNWLVATKTHRCGTAACVAGFAPEVYPEWFSWTKTGHPCRVGDTDGLLTGGWVLAYVLTDVDPPCNNRSQADCVSTVYQLFTPNNMVGGASDIDVAGERLATIRQCESYEQLAVAIDKQPLYF